MDNQIPDEVMRRLLGGKFASRCAIQTETLEDRMRATRATDYVPKEY